MDKDKSPCQIKKEREAKRCHRLLQDTYTSLKDRLRCNRKDAVVSLDGRPLALLEPSSEDVPAQLKWNCAVLRDTPIEKQAFVEAFNRGYSARDLSSVDWQG